MSVLDWTKFKKRISINAAPDVLFEYWMSQDNIEKWFLSKAEFSSNGIKRERTSKIDKGDKFVWMWHGADVVEEGEVLDCNDRDFLQFTFIGCTVSVKIVKEGDNNIVELIQENIPLDENARMNVFVECSRGWTFYMANLKSILEGGIDLRNKNMDLKHVINT